MQKGRKTEDQMNQNSKQMQKKSMTGKRKRKVK